MLVGELWELLDGGEGDYRLTAPRSHPLDPIDRTFHKVTFDLLHSDKHSVMCMELDVPSALVMAVITYCPTPIALNIYMCTVYPILYAHLTYHTPLLSCDQAVINLLNVLSSFPALYEVINKATPSGTPPQVNKTTPPDMPPHSVSTIFVRLLC